MTMSQWVGHRRPWTICTLTALVLLPAFVGCATAGDRATAPAPVSAPSSAWLANLSSYAFWPGDETPERMDGVLKKLRGFQMVVVHLRSAPETIRRLHMQNTRVLSYISFMDTYVMPHGWGVYGRVPWDPNQPQILLIGRRHRFINTAMGPVYRMSRFLVCNNTQQYVDAALAAVRLRMERGADGIFVDNSGRRQKCFGHNVPVGYHKRYGVVCELPLKKGRPPRKNPMLTKLPKHTHLYPDKTHDYAYGKLLEKVRTLVRRYGQDKVIVLNAGLRYADRSDGNLLESHLFSTAWTGPRYTWEQLKQRAAKYTPLVKKGHAILALDYLGKTRKSVMEDAMLAYATSRLTGLIWYGGNRQDERFQRMVHLQPGEQLTKRISAGHADYAVFENVVIAVNGGIEPASVVLRPPAAFTAAALENLFTATRIPRTAEGFRVTIPPGTGRVYLPIAAK